MVEKEGEEDDALGPTSAKPTLQLIHPRAANTTHYTPMMEIIIS
jgi:hypothetical protein